MNPKMIEHVYKSLEELLWAAFLLLASNFIDVGWIAITVVVIGLINLVCHLYHDFKLIGIFDEANNRSEYD